MTAGDEVSVESTGETVGEAKWAALRAHERLAPGLDKAAVRFQVESEGERGLLGVGYSPARVVATVNADAAVEAPARESHPDARAGPRSFAAPRIAALEARRSPSDRSGPQVTRLSDGEGPRPGKRTTAPHEG